MASSRPKPASEHARLIIEATAALRDGKPAEFQITGRAARMAEEAGIPLETVRTRYLLLSYENSIRLASGEGSI